MKHAIGATLIVAFLAAFGPSVDAAVDDYSFELQSAPVPADHDAVIAVRLLNKATGKPVADAVIFQTRFDMSPESMGEMTGTVTPLPAEEAGVYRFRVNPSMAGKWALKLAAKVPGAQETVRGDVIVTATR
ncbi:MAG: FixH family protein [Rhodospirillales bacterium]